VPPDRPKAQDRLGPPGCSSDSHFVSSSDSHFVAAGPAQVARLVQRWTAGFSRPGPSRPLGAALVRRPPGLPRVSRSLGATPDRPAPAGLNLHPTRLPDHRGRQAEPLRRNMVPSTKAVPPVRPLADRRRSRPHQPPAAGACHPRQSPAEKLRPRHSSTPRAAARPSTPGAMAPPPFINSARSCARSVGDERRPPSRWAVLADARTSRVGTSNDLQFFCWGPTDANRRPEPREADARD
jgi:hypothetical protein